MDNQNPQASNQKDVETLNRIVKKRGKGWAWALLLIAFVYIILPIDLIPDMIPVVGWIDDALIGIAAITNLIVRYKKA